LNSFRINVIWCVLRKNYYPVPNIEYHLN
jgi:hypothetical protein